MLGACDEEAGWQQSLNLIKMHSIYNHIFECWKSITIIYMSAKNRETTNLRKMLTSIFEILVKKTKYRKNILKLIQSNT
jgi:hypothetical protein